MDNAVWLSALVLALLVLASLVVLGLSGLRRHASAWSSAPGTGAAAAELSEEAERLSAAMAALPDRQAEVQDAVASLGARVRVLGVLTSAASDAADTLRAPLRYIGR